MSTSTNLICDPGYVDCDNDPRKGCEADLQRDGAHCGACNVPCSRPYATTTCVAGSCRLDACLQGYGDCDGDPTTGCEIDLRSTLAHCGRCNLRCPRAPLQESICHQGQCGLDTHS